MAEKSSQKVELPAPYTILRDAGGISSWRPRLTSLIVCPQKDGSYAIIASEDDNRIRFFVSGEDAAHVAKLLTSRPKSPKKRAA
jgi:hypothetical protein